METRKIKITLATAERWFNGNDADLKELALTTFPELGKKSLPKSWEELEEIIRFVVKNTDSEIDDWDGLSAINMNKSVFATREQAEASIALAQLSQLMKVYNDGWVADWSDFDQDKFCIEFIKNELSTPCLGTRSSFLAFKDAKTRDLFLENFRELIETAKPLL